MIVNSTNIIGLDNRYYSHSVEFNANEIIDTKNEKITKLLQGFKLKILFSREFNEYFFTFYNEKNWNRNIMYSIKEIRNKIKEVIYKEFYWFTIYENINLIKKKEENNDL